MSQKFLKFKHVEKYTCICLITKLMGNTLKNKIVNVEDFNICSFKDFQGQLDLFLSSCDNAEIITSLKKVSYSRT